MKDLLVIGCSNRKVGRPGLIPAIHRYDGPMFRTLRKLRREGRLPCGRIDILIVSARFGLISTSDGLPRYDERLSHDGAGVFATKVADGLAARWPEAKWAHGLLVAGKAYRDAVAPIIARACDDLSCATGGIGQKASLTRRWILERCPCEDLDRR